MTSIEDGRSYHEGEIQPPGRAPQDEKRYPVFSHLYLTSQKGSFVKVRATYSAVDQPGRGHDIHIQFLEGLGPVIADDAYWFAELLFRGHAQWHEILLKDHGILPRSISGVSSLRQQFIFILEKLDLGPVEQNFFVTRILERELAIAFVYATLMQVWDEQTAAVTEQFHIIAGTPHRFIWGKSLVTRSADGPPKLRPLDRVEGDNPQDFPYAWFLTSANPIPTDQIPKFDALWDRLRQHAHFRDVSSALDSLVEREQ